MKTIITIILTVLFAANSFAQTAYQQKCNQIFVKYMKMIAAGTGSQWGAAEQIALGNSGYSEEGAAIIKVGLMGYCINTGKSYDAMNKQLEAEYAAARKLMNADEKFAWKVNEESQVPYGRAKWQSAADFKEWSQKGEFETTEQHESRLKEQAHAKMDELLYENINKEMSDNFWKMHLGDYNADRQELQVFFIDNARNYQITRTISVSPQNAKHLKTHCYSSADPEIFLDGVKQYFRDDGQDDDGNQKVYRDEDGELRYYVNDEVVVMEYDTYEICIIDNKIFIPRFLNISSDFGEWQFDMSKEFPFVKYNFDDWVGKSQYLQGYVFDYQQYAATVADQIAEMQKQQAAEAARIAAQKAREDSVAIANYNRQLLHTVDSLNQILAANKYNLNHYAVSTDLGHITENDKFLFQRKQYDLIDSCKKYEMWIKSDYDDARREYSKLYSTKEDFDKYYCQGLERLAAQNEYRNAMLQLQQNKNSIAQVNFQKEINNNNFFNVISDQPVDYTDANEYRRKLLDWVAQYKSQPYYDEIVDFLITNNAALSKEFTKNGAKFSSKAEFYEAFTSGDYKAVLKGKK